MCLSISYILVLQGRRYDKIRKVEIKKYLEKRRRNMKQAVKAAIFSVILALAFLSVIPALGKAEEADAVSYATEERVRWS